MEGKPTKEFLHKLVTSDCIKEGLIKLNHIKPATETGKLLIFNAIRFTMDNKRNTINVTLIKDDFELINFTKSFVLLDDIGSVTFAIDEGTMKLTIE